MRAGLFVLMPLVLACGPKLPADRRYARDVAEAVRDGDERCAASGEADAVIERCAKLRGDLKPILLAADADAGAP